MKTKNIKSMVCTVIITAMVFCVSIFNANAIEMSDGVYEVSIKLWHSEEDKESMAASSVEPNATIVVENGVKTMHIETGEMTMGPISASLQELRVADSNGNYTDATVEMRNAEGDPIGFYFVMPHTEEYITVKVNPHLAMMGNSDIGARIKVDYSTLKRISDLDVETVAETTSPNEVITTVVAHTVISDVEQIENTPTQKAVQVETVVNETGSDTEFYENDSYSHLNDSYTVSEQIDENLEESNGIDFVDILKIAVICFVVLVAISGVVCIILTVVEKKKEQK